MPDLPDFASLLSLQLHPLELVLRGSAIYWFLFLLFRFVLRRDVGSLGVADILLLVLIADAAQNGMAGEYRSIADAFVLIGTLVAWNYAMDWGAFRFNAVRRLVEPPARVLVRRGRLVAANLRREQVTVPELMANLREHGIEKLAEVKMARLEPDGVLSVIRQPGGGEEVDEPQRRQPL